MENWWMENCLGSAVGYEGALLQVMSESHTGVRSAVCPGTGTVLLLDKPILMQHCSVLFRCFLCLRC